MSKRVSIALAAFIVVIGLAGCHIPKEVEGHPIDTRHTPAGAEIKTEYAYRLDILTGKLVLVPEVKQVTTPEKWEILWRITYDDGRCVDKWYECSKAEYEDVARIG